MGIEPERKGQQARRFRGNGMAMNGECVNIGGVYCGDSPAFNRGALPDVSRGIKAGISDAGVMYEYI